MEEGYVAINSVPTRVITIGGWIERPLKKKQLIIIIPGRFLEQICCLTISIFISHNIQYVYLKAIQGL